MRRVLFVRERWANGDQTEGPTDANHIMTTLEYCGGSMNCFYYDDLPDKKADRDAALLKYVSEYGDGDRPEVIIFTHLLNLEKERKNIKKETWQILKSMGFKIVGQWGEGEAPTVIEAADNHADCVDVNIFNSTDRQFLKHTKRPEKCLGLYDPRSRDLFKPQEPKKIGVIFIGSSILRPIRTSAITALLDAGIPVTKFGGRYEFYMEDTAMRNLLGISRICLNFSDAGPNARHYTGRVAEALLSGCMLMELDNEETPRILKPDKEYMRFYGPWDLVDKCKYFLEHHEEREAIAKAGRAKALKMLDGRVFWKKLFARLDGNGETMPAMSNEVEK